MLLTVVGSPIGLFTPIFFLKFRLQNYKNQLIHTQNPPNNIHTIYENSAT